MLDFFKHKKFWFPMTALLLFFLITEVLLRLGLYDQWLKPKSFLGNAYYREQAIKNSGLDKIKWISVGSSRLDWGINQEKFTISMNNADINYKKMSFESSNFTAIQATIDWSIAHMDNLEGVILGITENELSKFNILSQQFKIVWPFREYIDLENYQLNYDISEWEKYAYKIAWITYFPDIKSLLQNPVKRIEQIKSAKEKNVLTEKHRNPNNLCEQDVSTLQNCVAVANSPTLKIKNNKGYKLLKNICSKQNTLQRAKNNTPMAAEPNDAILINNWTKLIQSVTENGIQLTLVLMPEHESLQYILSPSNDFEITQNIINNVSKNEQVKIIDMRNLLVDRNDCEFFSDPLHLNNQGIELFTDELIKAFFTSTETQAIPET